MPAHSEAFPRGVASGALDTAWLRRSSSRLCGSGRKPSMAPYSEHRRVGTRDGDGGCDCHPSTLCPVLRHRSSLTTSFGRHWAVRVFLCVGRERCDSRALSEPLCFPMELIGYGRLPCLPPCMGLGFPQVCTATYRRSSAPGSFRIPAYHSGSKLAVARAQ